MSKLVGFVRLMRPINGLMMGFAVLVGAILATRANVYLFQSNLPSLLYGYLTGFFLTASSMVINDYYDRKIDAINEPARPIASGTVKPLEALVFASALAIIGLFFAYSSNSSSVLCLMIGIIAWLITVGYATVGKRAGLPGNFLVSACVATPFIFGSVVVTNTVQLNVLLFALMAFLSNTGREITKGIVDVKGDSAEGIKTLAVRYGEKKAAIASAAFYISAVALTPIPVILGVVSFWFIPFVLVTDIGLVVCSATLLKDYSRENARKVKKLVLIFFMFALLAYILGAL